MRRGEGQADRTRRAGGAPAALLAALLALAAPALGVVIVTGDGSGNTTAPPDDPGFDHVGYTTPGGHTAVYLGYGYVLTANHVGENSVDLLGFTYPPIAGSSVRLRNADDSFADLRVYQIAGSPLLAPVTLSSATPNIGDELVLIGHGWSRAAATTQWDVNWVEQPPYVYTGYKVSGAGLIRWGRNVVTQTGDVVLSTHAFRTLFDESGGVADECQVVSGDSGGGVFVKRGGEWELAGIAYAAATYPGQSIHAQAVFGNESIIADVAYYRDAILAAAPPPSPPPPISGLLPGAGLVLALALVATGRRAMGGGRR